MSKPTVDRLFLITMNPARNCERQVHKRAFKLQASRRLLPNSYRIMGSFHAATRQ
jgi:hypothetical protein